MRRQLEEVIFISIDLVFSNALMQDSRTEKKIVNLFYVAPNSKGDRFLFILYYLCVCVCIVYIDSTFVLI